MATLTFGGESFTVDHAVKGDNYVHGYDANGVCVVAFEDVSDLSAITYSGTYMSPGECATEVCNKVVYCGGVLQTLGGNKVTVGTSTMLDASVTRAKLAQNALYSPMVYPTETPYVFTASDIGKTFMTGSALAGSVTDVVYTVNDDFGLNVPNGTEIAIIARRGITSTKIVFEGVQKSAVAGEQMTENKTYKIPDGYGMVALKKINYGTNTSWWLVTGNVEVVS